MQTKQELENWYSNFDRWGYFHEPDDEIRLQNILMLLTDYERALDVGCGEGFITRHLPAKQIFGLDISENATSRLPENVIAINKPEGKYDLVISTGTLYEQYNHSHIASLISESASRHVLIAGIDDWLKPYSFGRVIKEVVFPYRQFKQRITLYEITS